MPYRTIPRTNSPFEVDGLSVCEPYWAVVTAINCGTSARSRPATYIDVHDPTTFTVIIELGNSGPCSDWLLVNTGRKMEDAKNFVLTALNDPQACDSRVTCVTNSTLTCSANENAVIYSYVAIMVIIT